MSQISMSYVVRKYGYEFQDVCLTSYGITQELDIDDLLV